jgi:competence protein ComEC
MTRSPLVGALLLCLTVALPAWAQEEAQLELHFLGLETHGESILIRTPADQVILVDAGMPGAGGWIVDYLEARGIERLDLVVLTHLDPDHAGGMGDVLGAFEVERFWESAYPRRGLVSRLLTRALRSNGVEPEPVLRGQRLELDGGVTLEVLSPWEPWAPGSDKNANSVVIRLTYGETRVLLTGDIDRETEERLLESGADLRCDLLKVPHHGSRTSSSQAFLEACAAPVAVICCQPNSPLGHPVRAVLRRLRDVGSTWYRTDRNGTVIARVGTSPGSLQVSVDAGGPDDETRNRVRPLEAARSGWDSLQGDGSDR